MVLLNTCHIREKAAEKVYSDLGRLRPLKAAQARPQDRRRGLRGPGRGRGDHAPPPAVDLVVGPQAYHRLPELDGRRRARARARSTPTSPSRGQVRSPQARPQGAARPHRLPDRAGRLRQVLRLLRRALHPRRRGQPPRRPILDEARGPGGARRARDHAARPERQRLPRRGRGRDVGPRPADPRAGARSTGSPASAITTSHPNDMDDDLIAAHGDCAQADALPAPAGAVGLGPHPEGDEPQAHRRLLLRAGRPHPRRAARHPAVGRLHRRLPRRDGGRFRGDAGPDPQRSATARPSASSIPPAPAPPPPNSHQVPSRGGGCPAASACRR